MIKSIIFVLGTILVCHLAGKCLKDISNYLMEYDDIRLYDMDGK